MRSRSSRSKNIKQVAKNKIVRETFHRLTVDKVSIIVCSFLLRIVLFTTHMVGGSMGTNRHFAQNRKAKCGRGIGIKTSFNLKVSLLDEFTAMSDEYEITAVQKE